MFRNKNKYRKDIQSYCKCGKYAKINNNFFDFIKLEDDIVLEVYTKGDYMTYSKYLSEYMEEHKIDNIKNILSADYKKLLYNNKQIRFKQSKYYQMMNREVTEFFSEINNRDLDIHCFDGTKYYFDEQLHKAIFIFNNCIITSYKPIINNYINNLKTFNNNDLEEFSIKMIKGYGKTNYFNFMDHTGIINYSENFIDLFPSISYINFRTCNNKKYNINNLNFSQMINFSHLRTLKINKGLNIFPIEICNISTLEYLYIEHGNLTYIPDDINKLTNLKNITLSYNNIETIPSVIDELEKLVILDLSHNNISSLNDLVKLRNVQRLILNYNNISEIPTEISGWQKLYKLSLTHNKITELPISIYNLCINNKLRNIILRENNIDFIDFDLIALPKSVKYSLTYRDKKIVTGTKKKDIIEHYNETTSTTVKSAIAE